MNKNPQKTQQKRTDEEVQALIVQYEALVKKRQELEKKALKARKRSF